MQAAAGAEGRGSPDSWNRDPQKISPFSSPTQERWYFQISKLKCFLKLASRGIQSHEVQTDSASEAFIFQAPSLLLARKEFCQKDPAALLS